MKTPILLMLCGMVAAKIPMNFDFTQCEPQNCESWTCNADDPQAADWCKCWKNDIDYPLCEEDSDPCTCTSDASVVMTAVSRPTLADGEQSGACGGGHAS